MRAELRRPRPLYKVGVCAGHRWWSRTNQFFLPHHMPARESQSEAEVHLRQLLELSESHHQTPIV